jgi:hypothetical protein
MNRNDQYKFGITNRNKRLIRIYRRLFIWTIIICIISSYLSCRFYSDYKYIEIERDLLKINNQNTLYYIDSIDNIINSFLFKKIMDSVTIDTIKPKNIIYQIDTTKTDSLINQIDTIKFNDTTQINAFDTL